MVVGGRLYDFIYSFHMPLFMLLSGYFVSGRMMSLSFVDMLIQKGKQLLLPAITCTVVCCIYLCFVRGGASYMDEFIGNTWFLKTLFSFYVIFFLVRRIKVNDTLRISAAIVLLFIIPRGSTLQFNLLFPYFCMGYLLRKYNILEKLRGRWLLFILFFFLFAGSYALQRKCYIPNYIPINIQNLQSQPHLILLRYFVAFSGSLWVISACSILDRYVNHRGGYKYVSSFGKYTLGVYVLQTLLVEYIFPDIQAWRVESALLFNAVVAPLLAVVFLLLCLLLILLLARNKYLDLLFLGGQYHHQQRTL